MVKIGADRPCFIIAEAGVNHNGDPALAFQLVDAACKTKVDAVKFQTFKAEKLVTKKASQYAMLKGLELSYAAFREIKVYCEKRDILFLSTPFDEESADFLEELGVKIFKIPSGELTNLPFLSYVASKKKPMIVSTGMATMEEVRDAVQAIQQAGNKQLILLHCVSSYPTDPRDANLKAMATMQRELQIPVGFSDHTMGIEVALAAVALGAKVIEKHFTLDRNLPGPDHQASLEPLELKALVEGIRKVEKALGHGRKEPVLSELEVAKVARKSLISKKNISKGTVIQKEWIEIKRPGTGLKPEFINEVIGLKAKKDIRAGEVLTWEILEQ